MAGRDTFLTGAQMRVLELRSKGLTQAEIARRLRTSRANICIIERRARANIAKAERTMRLAARLSAPVVVELKPGDDILEAPDLIFKAADGAKMKVGLTTPEIIARIRETAGDKLRGRSVVKGFELVLTADGDVVVY